MMPDLMDDIVQWHDREWPNLPLPKTPEQIALKLCEEAGEVAGAIIKMAERRPEYLDGQKARDEIGDVMIVLAVLCSRLMTTPTECVTERWAQIGRRKSTDYR